MLTGLKMSSWQINVHFYRLEQNIMQWKSPMELNLNQRNIPMDKIQKRRWEKWDHLSIYHVYTQSYGYENVASGSFFCILCWWQQKTSHSLGKIFKCIWKISFSSFSKCYELLSWELPFARCHPLKIQDFGVFCWLSSFSAISALYVSQTVTLKSINFTFFWKD